MSKKLFLLLGLAAAMALIAACAPAPTAVPAPTTAPAATAAPKATVPAATAMPAAVAGACGTLRILYWQAVTVLNSHHSQGTKDFDAARLVLEPMAAMGPDGVPVAILAAEVPTVANGGVSRDLTTVTWKLKQGVKWSDGSDFTADDVVFTYKYASTKETAATTAGTYSGIKSVEATDKSTVKLTWEAPSANPYKSFVSGFGNVLQKKQFEPFIGAKAKDGQALIPVGTGPFKFKEFKPNDVVTYDINPNYRDAAKGKPCFKEVTFKGGGDAPSAAKAVFQTGEVDYAWNLQVEAAVLVPMFSAADSKGVFVSALSPNLERILINRTNPDATLGDKRGEPDQPHPFLSDLNVRKALAMVIDTTEMAKQLYGPAGDGTCVVLNTPTSLVSKNIKCPVVNQAAYDAANKLLEDAGWKKGSDGIREKVVGGKTVKMNIVYQTTVNALRQKEQALVKDAWDKLGIKTEIKAVAAGVFFSTDEANPDTASKFWADVEMFTNGAESPDPTNYLEGWTCGEIKTKSLKWSGSNYERWCNKDYDALFDQLKKETDPAKRTEIAIKMNDLLVNDVVVIPLVARKSPVSGVSKTLKGILPNGWDSEMWNIADWTNK